MKEHLDVLQDTCAVRLLERQGKLSGFVLQLVAENQNGEDVLVTYARQPGIRAALVYSLQNLVKIDGELVRSGKPQSQTTGHERYLSEIDARLRDISNHSVTTAHMLLMDAVNQISSHS